MYIGVLSVCMLVHHVHAGFLQGTRGFVKFSRDQGVTVMSHQVGAENLTWLFCYTSQCSVNPSLHPSPLSYHFYFYFSLVYVEFRG